jgi:hypothetical protein
LTNSIWGALISFRAPHIINFNEQIEEEKNTEKISRELKMVKTSKEDILMLDRKLAVRVFTAGSPLEPTAYNIAP